ncbi:MAG: PTS sugar transporter subunit IIA [Pseudomonadota bacterium]
MISTLVARERLGSTGLGHGIALPHGRIKGLKRIMGALVRLDQGVDFDAIDGERVDFVCGLVVPAEATEEHLQVLASLAALFSETDMRDRLRRAESAAQLYDLLTSQDAAPVKQTAAPRR